MLAILNVRLNKEFKLITVEGVWSHLSGKSRGGRLIGTREIVVSWGNTLLRNTFWRLK